MLKNANSVEKFAFYLKQWFLWTGSFSSPSPQSDERSHRLSRNKDEVPQEGTELWLVHSSPPPGSPDKMVQAGREPCLWLLKKTLPLAMDLNDGLYRIPSPPFDVMLRPTTLFQTRSTNGRRLQKQKNAFSPPW